jgi:CubicO group peptidase (beta-lactamase class C family)
VNYALLGEIITRRSGQPYTSYVMDHILHPLGMKVAFSLTPEMKSDAARGYIEYWNPMRLMLRWFMPDVARKVSGPRIGKWMELQTTIWTRLPSADWSDQPWSSRHS